MGEYSDNVDIVGNADYLASRASSYRDQLESLHATIMAKMENVKAHEKWGDAADDFTTTFRQGDNGYDAVRKLLFGDGHEPGAIEDLGKGGVGLLEVYASAMMNYSDQDHEGGRAIKSVHTKTKEA